MSLFLKYTTTLNLALKPKRKNENCAGFDLYSTTEIIVPPRANIKIDTGIILEMQGLYYAQIEDKPENVNFKVIAGVIDPSYRGSIIVALFNVTNEQQYILLHDVIAQLLFIPILLPELIYTEELEDNIETQSIKTYVKYMKTNPLAFEPTRFEEGSVGYDLHALTNATVPPLATVKVDTGIILEMKGSFYGQIRDKSGFSTKRKLHVVNGVIDPNHKSTIMVYFQNLSDTQQSIFAEEKIAQIIFIPIIIPSLIYKNEIDLNTARGKRGFGVEICESQQTNFQ